jgi:hypothetical protein
MASWQREKPPRPPGSQVQGQQDGMLQRDELARELDQWAKRKEAQREDELSGFEEAKEPPAAESTPELPPTEEHPRGGHPTGELPTETRLPEAEATPAASDTAFLDDLPVSSEAFIEAIKAQADDLSVAPVPEVEILDGGPDDKPTRPIIWESEQRKLAALLRAPAAPKDTDAAEQQSVVPTLYSEAELVEMAQVKADLRDRIADLDVKIALLAYSTKEQADKELRVLEQALDATSLAVESTRKDVERSESILQSWQSVKRDASSRQRAQLAAKIASYDKELARKYATYTALEQEYREVYQTWQKNPTDLSIASKWGALGRQLEKEHSLLEEAVNKAVRAGIQRSTATFAKYNVVLDNLERRRSRLNRQIGIVTAFSVLSPARRREQKAIYLKERRDLVQQIEQYRRKLPDDMELSLLRNAKVKKLSSQ